MRRLGVLAAALLTVSVTAETRVSTLVGTGTPGYTDTAINNPYGLVIGPDQCLYFCDLDNQRIRRFDPKTRRLTTIAGSGERGYRGDGGPATAAALNMPHEIQFDAAGNLFIVERDSHVVRKVDMKSGVISTVAGTGVAGFSGDSGPAAQAQLRQPHSLAFDRDGSLLVTYAGTGEVKATPDGAPVAGTPLNGPRAMAIAPDGDLYLALREGNAIFRIDARSQTLHRVAGTGEQGYSGDGGPALDATLRGPKGLVYAAGRQLFVADTENHVIRQVDLASGRITTALGTGERGDGPETAPGLCKLARPHGLFADADGTLYVADSETHRIRTLK
jgi:DNA-binding beta-propeller fold protein YncE